MSSTNSGDGFTEVTRGSKKRKASSSPSLSQPKSGFSEPPLGSPVRPKSCRKNTIPVIISNVDDKFKSWKKLSGELRQYHPSLKVSRIKELPKDDFLLIDDTLQDVTMLQNKNKIKAALGKNVRVSLPEAFQAKKDEPKNLAIKRVPTAITDNEFKEFLDLNKVAYAKAERLKSKKASRVLPMFHLEINDPILPKPRH